MYEYTLSRILRLAQIGSWLLYVILSHPAKSQESKHHLIFSKRLVRLGVLCVCQYLNAVTEPKTKRISSFGFKLVVPKIAETLILFLALLRTTSIFKTSMYVPVGARCPVVRVRAMERCGAAECCLIYLCMLTLLSLLIFGRAHPRLSVLSQERNEYCFSLCFDLSFVGELSASRRGELTWRVNAGRRWTSPVGLED